MNLAAFLLRLGLVIFLILSAVPLGADEAPAAVSVMALEAEAQMREHLRSIDLDLRQRLSRIADGRAAGDPAAMSLEEIQELRKHLRSLQERIKFWQHSTETERDEWIAKVRTLEPLVDNLERATEQPESIAGLAVRRRALAIDWPGEIAIDSIGLQKGAANDNCADAIPIGNGTFFGDITDATPDGDGCFFGVPDVWFAYSSPETVYVVADTFGSSLDTAVAIHTGCPGTFENEVACNDDFFGQQSAVAFEALAGETYLIRVMGLRGDTGSFTLNVAPGGGISGTVTDEVTGAGIPGVSLHAGTTDGFFAGTVTTDSNGDYMVPGLPTSDFFIYTAPDGSQGYLPEAYDDMRCGRFCGPVGWTPIPVVAGTVTSGIDMAFNLGGSISGTVTEAATGSPIGDAIVNLWDEEGQRVGNLTFTSQEGHFSFAGLWADSYFVTVEKFEFRDELYEDIACQGGCDPTTGTAVEVSFGAATEGIDFELERLGSISGSGVDAVTGLPITTANVSVWNENGDPAGFGFVDGSGSYQVGGLVAGTYFVEMSEISYLDEVYDNLPCEPGCDPTLGMPIVVSLNSNVPDIDFALDRLGVMTGTVTDSVTGEPVSGIDVTIYGDLGPIRFSTTGVAGSYFIDGLLPGNYTALASNFEYINELYEEIPCEVDCDPMSGTAIATSLNTVTSDIDFTLDRKGQIAGRVSHAFDGGALRGAMVSIYEATGELYGVVFTEFGGNYLVSGLEPGTYFATASGEDYVAELYDDLPCADGCDPTAGTPIVVSDNTVAAGVDFSLERKGAISGRVFHAGLPVVDAVVDFMDANGSLRSVQVTDLDGRYVTGRLPAGTYFSLVRHPQFKTEIYDNLPCEPDNCDATLGTPIIVSDDLPTRGIDYDVGYCVPTATSLCLTGDRFRVEATWENFENQMGPAFADGLTADAGTFWFFNPGNIELVVKILDVCDRPENRFWVFGAGLTDVGVELKVTDELTGEVVTYDNPVGTPYEPVLDTQAFATCDAGIQRTGSAAVAPAPAVNASSLPAKGECLPGANTLCLNGGRFQAEVTWQAPNGDGGAAGAVSLADETGYFYFGGPDNVEVVVKVLDACELASNKFWVFGAGLTNFEVTLTVTDTVSDVTRVYTNDQGNNFEAITDTSAFDTCDAR